MKKLIALLIIGLLLFGCIGEPVKPPQNVTVKTAAAGDLVAVDYTLRLANGTILDTSIAEDAKLGGFYSATTTFKPLEFVIKDNNGLIPGFTNGVIGMKENETKVVAVPPEEAYGPYDLEKTQTLSLFYDLPLNRTFSRAQVESAQISIEKGQIVKMSFGLNMEIIAFDNDTVTMAWAVTNDENLTSSSMGIYASTGHNFDYNGLPSQIDKIDKDNFTVRWMLEPGKTYEVQDSQGNLDSFKVLSADNETVVIDRNHPLANETLYFTLVLKKIY